MATFREQERHVWMVGGPSAGGILTVARTVCAVPVPHVNSSLLYVEPAERVNFDGVEIETLDCQSPFSDAPARLIEWANNRLPDIIFDNSCFQVDDSAAHIDPRVRYVKVIHGNVPDLIESAIRQQDSIDAIIVIAAHIADAIRPRLRDPGKLHVVLNGVSLDDMPAADFDKRDGDVVFVGGASQVKGADDIFSFWPHLLDYGFNGRLHCVQHVDPAFELRMRSLPRQDLINIYGWMPRRDLWTLFARSRAFLVFSRREGLSMAAIEAMAVGSAPVCWDIRDTGMHEIAPEEFLLRAPLGNSRRLAMAAMDALEKWPVIAKPMAVHVRENFNSRRMAGEYLALASWLRRRPPASRPRLGEKPPPFAIATPLIQHFPNPVWRGVKGVVRKFPGLDAKLRKVLLMVDYLLQRRAARKVLRRDADER